MVTIYNGNLGLVKDTREARLPAGTSEVQFADVAAQIDPTSVHLKSLTDPAGLRILEQNYEYDLLSAQKLLEKYVGQEGPPLPGQRHLPRGDAPLDRRARLRHQRRDPHGPPRPDRVPVAAREPGLEAHAPVAAPERRDRAPAGRGVVPDRRHHLEGRLRGDPQRRRRPRRPDRVGDDRQQERRDLQGRGAQAGGRRREPRARGPHPPGDGAGGEGRGGGAGRVPRLRLRGVLRVPPLHARRPDHDQGQADQAAHAHDRRRRADPEGARLLRRARLLPLAVRHAHEQPEGERVRRAHQRQGEQPRRAAAEGQDPGLQGRQVRQPAARGRGLDRPHPEGRARPDQDGRGVRRRGRADPARLEEDRRARPTRSSGRSACATTRRRTWS